MYLLQTITYKSKNSSEHSTVFNWLRQNIRQTLAEGASRGGEGRGGEKELWSQLPTSMPSSSSTAISMNCSDSKKVEAKACLDFVQCLETIQLQEERNLHANRKLSPCCPFTPICTSPADENLLWWLLLNYCQHLGELLQNDSKCSSQDGAYDITRAREYYGCIFHISRSYNNWELETFVNFPLDLGTKCHLNLEKKLQFNTN